MTEQPDNQLPPDIVVGEEDETPQPRRAASAQFLVDTEVGTHAAMRDAMDPAHQSLADALRLSFRVLQVVILVLVFLFVFSGWKMVQDDQTGVLTVWGEIAEVGDERALGPGLKFSIWPYPAGEFILFKEQNRPADVSRTFWPSIGNLPFEDAVDAASTADRLRPGSSGSLFTADRELAHVKLSGRFAVADPVRFVSQIQGDADAERIVQLALQRATVHTAARLTVEEIATESNAMAGMIRNDAQSTLDRIESGIRLQSVIAPRATPPLAVVKAMADLQQAGIQVSELLTSAGDDANKTLTNAAGTEYAAFSDLIDEYQRAADDGDETLAAQKLVEINEKLEAPTTEGEVAQIINRARSYQSDVDVTLGQEARRFLSILPAFRDQPHLLVRTLWYETRANVLEQDDAEIIYAPDGLASLALRIHGLESVAEIRRKNLLERREMDTIQDFIRPLGRTMRARDLKAHDEAGRQLEINTETGRLESKGDN